MDRYQLLTSLGLNPKLSTTIIAEADGFGNLIPQDLFQCFSHSVQADIQAALLVGSYLKHAPYDAVQAAREGHRSLSGKGDIIGQKIYLALSGISAETAQMPVRVYAEEAMDDPRVLNRDDPQGIFSGYVKIVDPLDGTVARQRRHGTWCTATCEMVDGELIAGTIYAPSLYGGLLFVSEEEVGLWEINGELASCQPVKRENVTIEKAALLVGVDCQLYANICQLLPKLNYDFQVSCSTPSGLLGLAYLASGRADVIIQSPQKAWDWAQAQHALSTQGLKTFWFRLMPDPASTKCVLVRIEEPDYSAFCFNPHYNRLGFVAGQADLAELVFNSLPVNGWEDNNANTVGLL